MYEKYMRSGSAEKLNLQAIYRRKNSKKDGGVAQGLEQWNHNPCVGSSNLPSATIVRATLSLLPEFWLKAMMATSKP